MNSAYSYPLNIYDEDDEADVDAAERAGYNWDNAPTLDASNERNELAVRDQAAAASSL